MALVRVGLISDLIGASYTSVWVASSWLSSMGRLLLAERLSCRLYVNFLKFSSSLLYFSW